MGGMILFGLATWGSGAFWKGNAKDVLLAVEIFLIMEL